MTGISSKPYALRLEISVRDEPNHFVASYYVSVNALVFFFFRVSATVGSRERVTEQSFISILRSGLY